MCLDDLDQWAHQQRLEQQEWEESMALIATNKGGSFELAPAGTFVARCYRIVDLGTQYSDFYKKSSHKIRIYWELPTETMSDGKIFSVSKQYTLSLHEKAQLRQMLEAWRGRKFTDEESAAFDLSRVVGQPCMLNVAHSKKNGQEYNEITSVMAMPKGMQCPPQVNNAFLFDLSNFDQQSFESLSDNMKDKIRQSVEYKRMTGQAAPMMAHADMPPGEDMPPETDDDIPWG